MGQNQKNPKISVSDETESKKNSVSEIATKNPMISVSPSETESKLKNY